VSVAVAIESGGGGAPFDAVEVGVRVAGKGYGFKRRGVDVGFGGIGPDG
jgi:hypothetical protein